MGYACGDSVCAVTGWSDLGVLISAKTLTIGHVLDLTRMIMFK